MRLVDVSTPSHPNTFAMVDDADYDRLSKWKWSAVSDHGRIYARGGKISKGSGTHHKMHRFILAAPPSMQVDHIDGNGLNNQRSNLRLCNIAENNRNRRKPRGKCLSAYKGVSFDPTSRKNPWRAKISQNGNRVHLGSFPSQLEAAKAYDAAARSNYLNFAKPNFTAEAECAS